MSGRVRYRHLFDLTMEGMIEQRRKWRRLGWKPSGGMSCVSFGGGKLPEWSKGDGCYQTMERADP